MKEEIKVGVFCIRTVEMEPSYCLTVDNDIPPAYGIVKRIVRVYFSEQLEEQKGIIYRTIGHITNHVTQEYIKVSPEEPWVDTTPLKHIFEKDLTSEVVRMLSEVLPDYKFRCARYPEEAKQLIKKNEREINQKRRRERKQTLVKNLKNLLSRMGLGIDKNKNI